MRNLINRVADKVRRTFATEVEKNEHAFNIESYAQEGEDLILHHLLISYKGNGFYVDVGAHHPMRLSNTYLLYRKGWSGINIDATPGSMGIFKQLRPRDINLEEAISNGDEKLIYCCFNEPALNGFDGEVARSRDGKDYQIIDRIEIQPKRLKSIFEEHLPSGQTIDILSVDVEGFDLEVLKSNDWDLYQPVFVLIEDHIDLQNPAASEVYSYLHDKGYTLIAKTPRTSFYQKA